MAIKTLHLVRHGQYYQIKQEDKGEHASSVGPEADEQMLRQDGGLTPTGNQQAELLARRLSTLNIHVIHTSSMPRAKETAAIIAKALPNALFEESRDLWECIPHVPTKLVERAKSLPAEMLASDKAHADAAFETYFQPASDDGQDGEQREVIVCHGNIIRYLICRALKITPDAWIDLATSNCSVCTIGIGPDGTCKLEALNDVRHLPPALITYESVKVDDVSAAPSAQLPSTAVQYTDSVLDTHRHLYCPKCATPAIQKVLFDDNVPRTTCPNCGWIQLVGNAVSVAVVAHKDGQIAVIEPPEEDGIALPAGLVEYGESPTDAAVREALEETGLAVKIVDELGWFFDTPYGWPGPNVKFMYEAEIIGGQLKGSDEGPAKLVDTHRMPPVSSGRTGSKRALAAYFNKAARGRVPSKKTSEQ